jgi:hypothetical protein
MNKFLLIDHSIKRIGGHNYEYALHILSAAEQQGLRPILAANRRFFERKRLPTSWQLFTPFRHTTYEAASANAKERFLDPDGSIHREMGIGSAHLAHTSPRTRWLKHLPKWLRRGLVTRYERLKSRIIERYAADMASLIQQLPLQSGDHVFVPTLSQDDLIGLLAFFRANEDAARNARWHLQFHFSLYDGRQPDYAAQDARLAQMRRLFQAAARALPRGCLRFYATTDILASQFNRLGGARFEALPYPVNPELLTRARKPIATGLPLRVTCAGGVRVEKGTGDLYRAISPLWDEYVETGRLQLVVQAKRLAKLPRELRPHARYDSDSAPPAGQRPGKVAIVRWPLSTEKYLHLIRNSAIGLLLYDADQYYARCSGVMVEMLKAGIPVIVPAGCWMAEMIAEAVFEHRDKISQTLPLVERMTAANANWSAGRAQAMHLQRADARPVFGALGHTLSTQLAVPPGATHLCVRFRFAPSNPQGSYLEIAARSTSYGRSTGMVAMREIVGMRRSDGVVSTLVPLGASSDRIDLVWRNAFGNRFIEIEHLEFVFLAAGPCCPFGAVGLISAGVDQVPVLLRDMAENYDHYRRTAADFAPAWGEWHSPEKVVALLTTRDAARHRSAA